MRTDRPGPVDSDIDAVCLDLVQNATGQIRRRECESARIMAGIEGSDVRTVQVRSERADERAIIIDLYGNRTGVIRVDCPTGQLGAHLLQGDGQEWRISLQLPNRCVA